MRTTSRYLSLHVVAAAVASVYTTRPQRPPVTFERVHSTRRRTPAVFHPVALTSIALLVAGCAAHTNLVPLGQGNIAPVVSVGGPIVEAFDTHIPIPYLTAGADYGLRERVNLSAALHVLPLAYGVAGLDVGAIWFVSDHDGWTPTVGFGPRLFFFASVKPDVDERILFYPAASASAAWETGPGLLYLGSDLAVPLSSPKYDEEASPVLISPFAGYRWHVSSRTALLLEVKLHGMNVISDKTGRVYFGRKSRRADSAHRNPAEVLRWMTSATRPARADPAEKGGPDRPNAGSRPHRSSSWRSS